MYRKNLFLRDNIHSSAQLTKNFRSKLEIPNDKPSIMLNGWPIAIE